MSTLLRIDSSARINGSHSSRLADLAEERWLEANPGGRILRRHVGAETIPVLSQETITGFYAASDEMTDELKQATSISDALIGELHSADTLLLAVPIYNFGVPAALKCWIDQVTRMGQTFAYEDGSFKGLLTIQRAIVICAYGSEGYLPGQSFEQANFLEPYLRFLLSFLGINEIDIINVQATTADDATVAAHLAGARADITAAFAPK